MIALKKTCPNCGVKLVIKNSHGESTKQVRCPKCKQTFTVNFPPEAAVRAQQASAQQAAQQQAEPGATQYMAPPKPAAPQAQSRPQAPAAPRPQAPTPAANEMGATQYMAPPRPQATGDETQLQGAPAGTTGGCFLVCNGQRYPLKAGVNTIGRQAHTSQATVQLATQDRTMSRVHALIRVIPLPGGSVRATICNSLNKNDTLVDGQLLAPGDELMLRNGAQISFSRTTVTFFNS